jgi:membrane peptidoglycan carboxypeptidase
MKKLYEHQPSLSLPNLRKALVLLHMDLFQVQRYIARHSAYSPASLTALEMMTIVLEDRRFMRHHGVDVRSIFRETVRAFTLRRHGGASTIDMQFVRTVTGYQDLTLRRKLYECVLAFFIQFRYSKIIILRSYLSCAYFGAGLRGADPAAQKIFGKEAESLSVKEAAFIAAMLVCPRPSRGGEQWELRVKRRANYGERIYIANKERFDKLPS